MVNKLKNVGILLLVILTLVISETKAQHTILLLNGKTIKASTYSLSDIFLQYKKPEDHRKSPRIIDRYDVFSVIKSDSVEEVIYAPIDSLDYSIEEARLYIQGEQAAHQFYKKNSVKWSSAAIGLGASALSFYALPIPMIYSLALGRANPKPDQLNGNYSTVKDHDAFITGYQKAARNIKIQQSLKWGYVSLGVGITGFILVNKLK